MTLNVPPDQSSIAGLTDLFTQDFTAGGFGFAPDRCLFAFRRGSVPLACGAGQPHSKSPAQKGKPRNRAYARLPRRSPIVRGTAVGTPVSRPAQHLQRRGYLNRIL